MDNFIPWLNNNLMSILTGIAAVFCGFVILLILAWIAGLIYKLCIWGANQRFTYLKRANDCQGIRLQMKRRNYEDGRLADEVKALQAAAVVATAREQDIRKLLAAQNENLANRDTIISKLRDEVKNIEEALDEQEEINETCQQESLHHEQLATKADSELQVAREENANQRQIISMLEGQLASQKNAASMANAGMDDHRRELEQTRNRLQIAQEQIEFLKRLIPQEPALVNSSALREL